MRCKSAEALAFLLRETKGLDMLLAMDDEGGTVGKLLKALDDPSKEVVILVLRVTIACRAAYNAYEATVRLVKYGFIERCIALLRHEEERVSATACSALATIFSVKEAFIRFIRSGGMAEVTEALKQFDISTGRFGDPDLGRYQELSDGRFKVLPSREAQDKWTVDRQLLPGPLQDKLQRAELQQKLRHEAIERRYQQKLQYNRYRKWDSFLRKAKEKGQREKSSEEEEVDAVRPLPPKRRLSQLLRKGRDKAPVEGSVKAKYTRSL